MSKLINIVTANGKTFISGQSIPRPVIQSSDGSLHEPVVSGYSRYEFDYLFREGDMVMTNVIHDGVVWYVAKANQANSIKQEIDESVFKQLPTKLQKLYTKRVAQVGAFEPLEGEQVLTDLHLYASQNAERVLYTAADVVHHLMSLNFKGVNKRAMISSSSTSRDDDAITVYFFATDYNGETRKILSTKRDGRPYADKRGRFVPNYPAKIDEVFIPSSKLPVFSASSQSEMDRKVQDYFDYLTMTHLLEEGAA